MNSARIGIILLNLGGPGQLSDVAPFLFNLFSDRDIIRLGPAFLQKPLAWFIARRRAGRSKEIYARIGGGSPLTRITLQQEQVLQMALESEGYFKVVTAMRYWPPRADHALERLVADGISEVIALPLYPHYSRATTGSSLADLKRAIADASAEFHLRHVDSWFDHPAYIACLAARIEEGLRQFAGEHVRIVYSAHSLPASFIEQGDPYLEHIRKTIAAVEKTTGREGVLCFQSRSGPVRWLSPSTPETICQLSRSGCKNILMVPISFVSDHVETLFEINQLYKSLALEYGMRLESTASFNAAPDFIRCLKEIVLRTIKSGEAGIGS